MMADQLQRDVQGGLTEDEKRSNVIRLAFGGSPERFEAFCRTILISPRHSFVEHLRACDVLSTPDAAAASDHFPLRLEVED